MIAAPSARTRFAFGRLLAAVAFHLLMAGSAVAQVQGYPVSSEDRLPAPATPPVTQAGGQRGATFPPIATSRSGSDLPPIQGEPIELVPHVGPGPVWQPPVPPPEVDHPVYEDPFRFRTQKGGTYTGLPRTLLWEPPLAVQREPRFMAMPTTLSNASTKDTVDTSIGGTIGLLRAEPANWKTAIQSDFFAVVTSRFSQYNYQIAADYRFGLPVTFSRGQWQWKIGYEHTSAHLGDEAAVMMPRVAFPFVKDEVVFGVGRFMFDGRWRVYGQGAWAAYQNIPGNPSPFRFDLGTEYIHRRCTGCWGKPYAATNLRFDGDVDYSPDMTVQLGWMWRDGTRRFGEARVFGQYFNGHSPYGQFYQDRESWFGVGVAFDY
ncbi:MAG: hypothetical protein C0467_24000 [Planctomycetaceae bacterium]|nr:hypothetical protein [Planctomycetaceae bacterium]